MESFQHQIHSVIIPEDHVLTEPTVHKFFHSVNSAEIGLSEISLSDSFEASFKVF